jgi:phosphatidate phosphatase APP1
MLGQQKQANAELLRGQRLLTEEARQQSEWSKYHSDNCESLHDDVHDCSLKCTTEKVAAGSDKCIHLLCHAEIDHRQTAVLQRFQLRFATVNRIYGRPENASASDLFMIGICTSFDVRKNRNRGF